MIDQLMNCQIFESSAFFLRPNVLPIANIPNWIYWVSGWYSAFLRTPSFYPNIHSAVINAACLDGYVFYYLFIYKFSWRWIEENFWQNTTVCHCKYGWFGFRWMLINFIEWIKVKLTRQKTNLQTKKIRRQIDGLLPLICCLFLPVCSKSKKFALFFLFRSKNWN